MIQIALQRFYYIFSDFVSVNIAWFLFNIVRFYTLPYNYPYFSFGDYLSFRPIIMGQVCLPILMIALYAISGYYNKVFSKSRYEDISNSAGVSLVGSIIIFFLVLFNDQIEDRMGNFEMVGILWLLLAVLTSVPRLMITTNVSDRIWRRKIFFNAILIGPVSSANSVANDLETKYRGNGFKVVGIVDPSASIADIEIAGQKIPVISYDVLEAKVKELDVSSFIIVDRSDSTKSLIDVINSLMPLGKSIYLTPDTYHIITLRPRISKIAGQMLVDVSTANIPESTVNLKRISDIVVSALALVALSPLFGIIAFMIKRDSKGPVFYAQERVGYKKKIFKIYKFRSMIVDSEKYGPALSSIDDPRITKIGKILRKYRIDELPQFWNVLKGDMSLVGPRPERAYYLNEIIKKAPYYNLVHQVRPGITSWGMVKYGYASNVDEMIERLQYDLIYIDNVSIGVDIKILFYTINTIITGKGI